MIYLLDKVESDIVAEGKDEKELITNFKKDYDMTDYLDGTLLVLKPVGSFSVKFDLVRNEK